MKVLLNTSFFYSPSIADEVHQQLKSNWIPACGAVGVSEPMCLKLPMEENIKRMAVQTMFASASDARRFRDECLAPIAEKMTLRFGVDAFTCFTSLMEIVEL